MTTNTANRISLGNGKFCYSGPNCKWHSPNGAAKLNRDLQHAQLDVNEAKDFDAFQKAQEKLVRIQSDYDTTNSGITELEASLKKEKDPVLKRHLKARLESGKQRAIDIEKDQQQAWNATLTDEVKANEAATTKNTEMLNTLTGDSDASVRFLVAQNPNLNSRHLKKLSKDFEPRILQAVAANPNVSDVILKELEKHSDTFVKAQAKASLARNVEKRRKQRAVIERERVATVSAFSYSSKGGK